MKSIVFLGAVFLVSSSMHAMDGQLSLYKITQQQRVQEENAIQIAKRINALEPGSLFAPIREQRLMEKAGRMRERLSQVKPGPFIAEMSRWRKGHQLGYENIAMREVIIFEDDDMEIVEEQGAVPVASPVSGGMSALRIALPVIRQNAYSSGSSEDSSEDSSVSDPYFWMTPTEREIERFKDGIRDLRFPTPQQKKGIEQRRQIIKSLR